MRNLLDRLKEHPNLDQFQNLIVFPSGQVSAVYRNGSLSFPDLDAVEKFAYPDEDGGTVLPESFPSVEAAIKYDLPKVAEPSRLSPTPPTDPKLVEFLTGCLAIAKEPQP